MSGRRQPLRTASLCVVATATLAAVLPAPVAGAATTTGTPVGQRPAVNRPAVNRSEPPDDPDNPWCWLLPICS